MKRGPLLEKTYGKKIIKKKKKGGEETFYSHMKHKSTSYAQGAKCGCTLWQGGPIIGKSPTTWERIKKKN